ncbi:MAG: hypothetical protein ACP5HK_05830 [Acidilobus sp.]
MSQVVPCQSLGVYVRFGDATCYSDGTVTVSGPAVLFIPSAVRSLDGRSRRVGRVQADIIRAVSSGHHLKEEMVSYTGASPSVVAASLAALVRKGLLRTLRATSGGPCRTYYLTPDQSPDELMSRLGLSPCRRSSRARPSP